MTATSSTSSKIARPAVNFHHLIATLGGARGAILDVALGLASGLSFAPANFWPGFAIASVLFLWRLDGAHGLDRRFARAFGRGYRYGLGFYVASLYWVANAFLVDADRFALFMPFLVGGLIALMALFPAAASLLAMRFWSEGAGRVFVLAFAMSLADFLRGHIWVGLPWNLAGELWRAGGAMSQSASLFGTYGLGIITFFASFSPAVLWDAKGRPVDRFRDLSPIFIACGLMGVLIGWGMLRLREPTQFASGAPVVRVVETGFTQQEQHDPNRHAELVETLLQYSGSPGPNAPGIIVWPESALPDFVLERSDILEAMEARLGPRTLILGTNRRETAENGDIRYFNSMAVLARDPGLGLRPFSVYDKTKLVPFGEYIPGGTFLAGIFERFGFTSMSWIAGGFTPGAGSGILNVPGAPAAGPLICYEAIFPGFVAKEGERPSWLVQVSNDAWFGPTSGPLQHYNQARFRAIEQGIPLVRAASGGISGIIDGKGRTVVKLGTNGGYADSALPKPEFITLFSRFGDALTLGLFTLLGLTGWFISRRGLAP